MEKKYDHDTSSPSLDSGASTSKDHLPALWFADGGCTRKREGGRLQLSLPTLRRKHHCVTGPVERSGFAAQIDGRPAVITEIIRL